jgi:ribosome biogenesis GTPase
MKKRGIIFKGIGGNYYIHTQEGIYVCRARGLFRKEGIKPLVGDYVVIDVISETKKEGYVIEIEERKAELIRPHVANVEQVIITMAATRPNPNFILLDKLIVLSLNIGLEPIICFNKVEFDSEELIDKVASIYADAGHQVVLTSAKKGYGIETLREMMRDKINVFAGPSGVGKSSLINTLMPGMKLKIGEVSEKIQRGKHTTRHSELMPLDFGGYVLDTPGFTSLDLTMIAKGDLRDFYREFEQVHCQFRDCHHINEPKCGVKLAVKEERISVMRYKSYCYLYEEINNRKERY